MSISNINKQRGIVEMIIAVLMGVVLIRMLFTTRMPKGYTCRPQKHGSVLFCEYNY